MFTLEDLDLGEDLQDLQDGRDRPAADPTQFDPARFDPAHVDEHGGTTADADARLHPSDYFIAGV